ncbi:hypothetical protein ADEAN_000018400 [Angomonas deanei]|uniref:Uncharacterized protein n=1 Tax=Angomonas deanei TaxID=59799 RepID=A0A7G2C4F4_9TRYP|nr:hypothetical protein ADEAN_000018400 [Angomonas deanei]
MVVPPLPMRLEQTSATLSQQRKLSRAVVCVVLVFLLTLPVYTFPYPKAVPSFLSLFLFLLVLALLVCSINSSLRTLQCTSAPLAQAEVWAKVEEDQLRLELEEDLSEEDEGGQAPPERKERDQDGHPADHEEPQEGSAAEPGEEGRISLSPSSSDEGEHVKGSKHLQLPTGNYNPHHLRNLNNNDSMIDNSSFNHIDRTSLENMVNSPKRPLNNNENEV